jgi:hypothetical protein
MAIGFVQLTQSASGGSTDPMSVPALPTGTTDGNMVLLFVQIKYGDGVTINTPTDWNIVSNTEGVNSGFATGNDSGNERAIIFWREKTSGWSTMPAVDLSGAYDSGMRGVISYSKASNETWVTPVGANAVDNTGSSTGLDPPASGTTISFASGDWFGSYGAINGNLGTIPVHTATVAGVTFGASNTRLDATTSAGSDHRAHSIDMTYSSGTASAGPDGAVGLTAAATTCGGVMCFYRLRVTAGVATSRFAGFIG